MFRFFLLVVSFLCALCAGSDVAAGDEPSRLAADDIKYSTADWPRWRGPQGNGVADPKQSPPTHWDASTNTNVVWKVPIPGRGHSSPIVVNDRVILTTAEVDREVQSMLCFDRKTGAARWRTEVHHGGLERKGNKKTTQASSTVACDGQRLIVNFLNRGAIYTTALDLDGKQLWQTKVSEFDTHQGFGSSPTVDGPLAFVTTDNRGGGVVAALERATGKVVWQSKRPAKDNYASAVVLHAGGRKQLVVQGCDLVSSFEPLTGQKLWEMEGATTECVTSLVTDGERVFASGGYPRKHVQAVLADGSGKTTWESNSEVYVPSMVVHQGHLYAVLDKGFAACWKSDTGKELWKERVGGTFTASLVLVGDNIFAINESGENFIFKANSTSYEQVAKNKLGNEVYATPAICGGQIFMRVVEDTGGQRQEMLYCLGSR